MKYEDPEGCRLAIVVHTWLMQGLGILLQKSF